MIDRDARDQHVDRLLREAMRGPVRAAAADCLDVEALAAWSEGSLGSADRARAEAHAATCTRCQAMLAAMIRSAPVVEAASPSPFRKWLMILGPALGAAAAVALWFAVDRPARRTDISPQVQTMARADAPATPIDKEDLKARVESGAPAAPGRTSVPPAAATAVSALRGREADRSVADDRGVKKEAAKTLDRLADAKARAVATPQSGMAETVAIAADAPPRPTPSPAPPPAAPQRVDQVPALPSPTQSQSQGANQNVNQAPPPPSVNAGQPNQAAPAERRADETAASAPRVSGFAETVAPKTSQDAAASKRQGFGGRPAAAGTFDVPTSNPLIRYHVADGRTVQRTADGGKTWTTGHIVLTSSILMSGAAPSPTVCWLVGTSGLVLTTGDGVTWREAKLPVAVDIKSITAGDANTAIVILTDGRSFSTTNGGVSWNRPQ